MPSCGTPSIERTDIGWVAKLDRFRVYEAKTFEAVADALRGFAVCTQDAYAANEAIAMAAKLGGVTTRCPHCGGHL